MKEKNVEKTCANSAPSSQVGGTLHTLSVKRRAKGLRTAGFVIFFISLILGFFFGFGGIGLGKPFGNIVTASAAAQDDWNNAVTLSSASAPQRVTLQTGWSSSSLGSGAGFTGNGLYVPAGKSVILDLNGNTISRGLGSTTSNGFIIYVAGTLVIENNSANTGIITGGFSSNTGGGIHIVSGGTVTLKGGNIYANRSSGNNFASGVYVAGGATFNMEGGNVTTGTATGSYGGAVYVANGGTFNMTGGSINNNTSSGSYGSAVYLASGANFRMTGGSVQNNKNNYYGVYAVDANVKVSMGGSAFIDNNVYTDNTTPRDFYSNNNYIDIVSSFTSAASISVHTTGNNAANHDGQPFTRGFGTYNSTKNPWDVFVQNNAPNYSIVANGSGTSKEAATWCQINTSNWINAVNYSKSNNRVETCILYSNWTAGNVTGSSDSTIRSFKTAFGTVSNNVATSYYYCGALNVPVGAHVILDLNGCTLNRGMSSSLSYGNGWVINVFGTLEIIDSSAAKTGRITGGYYGINVQNGGILKIQGGTISGNMYYGIYNPNANTTFEMTGGTVTGNGKTSTGYYGVYIGNNSAKVNLGGSAYVYNNKGSNNVSYDLYYMGKINVVKAFTSNAQIGVHYGNNNSANPLGNIFTQNYGKYNTVSPTTIFNFPQSNDYGVIDNGSGATLEGAMWCYNNATNWSNAVNYSVSNGTEESLQLYSDWVATNVSTSTNSTLKGMKTSFNSWSVTSNASYAYYGSLNVPAAAKIKLDLNGYKLDRAFTSSNYLGNANGAVVTVWGGFELCDTSEFRKGVLTGGCYGIYMQSGGHVTLNGGKIVNNNWGGYGVYANGDISMGDYAEVYDNTYNTLPRNVYLTGSSVINILSPFKADTQIGVTRTYNGPLTVGWGASNSGVDPVTYFVSDNDNYRVLSEGEDSEREAVILSKDNATNWAYAVKTSFNNGGRPELVSLTKDWVATDQSKNSNTTVRSWGTTFGISRTDTNYYDNASMAYYLGALCVPAGAHVILDLNNYKIDRAYTNNYYAFYVKGTLEIIDESDDKGGIITRANIAINIADGGQVIMSAGKITGVTNYAVNARNNTTFTMSGGEITGNTLSGYGIYAASGADGAATLELTGGRIYNNKVNNYAVYVNDNEENVVNIGGRVYVNGNVSNNAAAEPRNAYFAYTEQVLNVQSALDASAHIGFVREGVGDLTVGYGKYHGEHPEKYFTSHHNEYLLSDGGEGLDYEAVVICHNNAINWQYAVSKSLKTGTTQKLQLYSDWDAEDNKDYAKAFGTTSAYRNGGLYVPVGASVILDMHGFSINRGLQSARQDGYVFYIEGELEIIDESDVKGSVIKGGKNSSSSSAGGIHVVAGGTCRTADVTITENLATGASAGGVYVGGTFEAENVVITANTGASAGGVYVAGMGSFDMTNVEIVQNTGTSTSGGGVYTAGTLTMSGGSISENIGTSGGIYIANGGDFTMDGGYIESNEGTSTGGVFVYPSSASKFTMKGGRISTNQAASAGGVYAAGQFVMEGGEIVRNTASGAFVSGSGNTDEGCGGGVYVASSGTFTITGGLVSGNTGTNGVRVYSSGVLNVGGSAQVLDNYTADGEECDVYLTAETRTMNVVSTFTSDAHICIRKENTGTFTKGYGQYNTEEPSNFFYSENKNYKVSKTVTDNPADSEAFMGTPIDRPVIIEDVIYGKKIQEIVAQYDPDKMEVYGELPQGVTFADGKFTAIEEGVYPIQFVPKTGAAGYCWDDGSTRPYTLYATILPFAVELSWQNHEFTYDGQEHAPVAEVANLFPGDECEVEVEGAMVPANMMNGNKDIRENYKAMAWRLSNHNYTLEGGVNTERPFIIYQAPIEVEITTLLATYDEPYTLEVSGNAGRAAVTYTVTPASTDTGTATITGDQLLGTKVGTVTVTAEVAESMNYLAGTTTAVITVQKGKAPIVISTKEAIYKTPVTLQVDDNRENGAVTFTDVRDKTGSATVTTEGVLMPLWVGTVTVYATVSETENYHETEFSAEITIKPYEIHISWNDVNPDWGGVDFVYNKEEQIPTATIDDLFEGDKCELEILGGQIDAGKYEGENAAYVNSIDNENYTLEGLTDEEKKMAFEIHKAPLELTIDQTDGVYGTPLTLTVSGNEGNGGVSYEVTPAATDTGSATVSGDVLTPTKAGTVTITATVEETANYLEGTVTAEINIDRAELNPEITTVEAIYRTDLTLQLSGNEENGAVTYTVTNGTGSATVSGDVLTPTHVGKVTVTADVAETDNYKAGTASAEIEISPFAVELVWTDGTFVYDTQKHTPTATVSNLFPGDDCDVTVADGNIDAGTYTASATALSNENYTLTGGTNLTKEYEIKPLAVKLDWANFTFTYNGKEQAPTATVANLFTGDTCEVTVSGATDAGKDLTATATALSNANYTLEGGENLTATFTIDPLIAELEWTDTTLVYNKQPQKPTATVKNLVPGDTCTVTVTGEQTNAGVDYIATADSLSNPNYTLDGAENTTTKFTIEKAPLDLALTTVEAIYRTDLTLQLSGNEENGAVTYTVTNGTGSATVSGDVLTPTHVGKVTVTADVAETDNYKAGTASAEIEISPFAVELVWTDGTFVYDTQKHTPTATVSNLFPGDDCDVTVADGNIDAGTYTASALNSDGTDTEGMNYAIPSATVENFINSCNRGIRIQK